MMSRTTGRAIGEDEHIRQSVADILTTPIGSRVERRAYGSNIPDLIDFPATPANRLRLMSASVMALTRWEPRIGISTAAVDYTMDGKTTITLDAVKRRGQRAGQPITLVQALK
ncbi:GPW/gp25 family protein [Azonexus sp. R2A61]|uniref:GPW/gp25 family protein n=1 Tax=Azonexus sp. R2A61 TaxID=2744443 RepID=UPI001F182C77|nr:GPW/gp25 family protein [Azonexus sp. R2A61]